MSPVERSRRWQKKQQKKKNCPLCADPVARSCQEKTCKKFRVHTSAKTCPNCRKKTKAHRLCSRHLDNDRRYREKKNGR